VRERERTIVRRASRQAVADRAGDERVYDVVLLAGSPRRYTVALAPDLAEGSVIDVDGEQWTVADVRAVEGAPSKLICIYAA
jgi:hypothetical protein